MSTLQWSFFSSTYFVMYVLAVEPAHACSLIVTLPHDAPRVAAAPPAIVSAAAAAIATEAQSQRFDIPPSSLLDAPARAPVPLCDPVECNAEREDRERRHHALPERVSLESLGDLVTES